MRASIILASITTFLCLQAGLTAGQTHTGGIQAYLNAQALNDTLSNFAKVMPEFLMRESNLVFNFDVFNGWFWDMHIYGIKVEQLDIEKSSFKIVPGERNPTLLIEITDTDLIGHV
jgi:hypothetical protein